MLDALTDVAGIEVGHAGDDDALTGCTVVLCRQGAVVGVDVRGRAPGTRETDLCRPGMLVERAHAIVLTGGSAFGLAAADGVMRYLFEQGIGFETNVVPVPIVPAAVIFDLGIGRPVWPDAAMGYEAARRASGGAVAAGCVGAGLGATVGKLFGAQFATKSGIGTASMACGDFVVAALMVVNALGDVVLPGTNTVVAGARRPEGGFRAAEATLVAGAGGTPPGTNTTIGVVATDATLTDTQTSYLAEVAHDGLARTLRPAHTMADGDTIFALATGASPGGSLSALALATAIVQVVERAVVHAVRAATPAGGLPAAAAEGTVGR